MTSSEVPEGLSADQQLTFTLGAIVRAETALLSWMLLIEEELVGSRKSRPVNQVIASVAKALSTDPRYAAIASEVNPALDRLRVAVSRRNSAVHTLWPVDGATPESLKELRDIHSDLVNAFPIAVLIGAAISRVAPRLEMPPRDSSHQLTDAFAQQLTVAAADWPSLVAAGRWKTFEVPSATGRE